MRKSLSVLFVAATMLALLAGCGNTTNPSTVTSGVPVSLSMTDDPPAGVQVLFFQVSLTAASLTPASGSPVSLLSNNTPIQIDVTQLQALSAFLSTANVAAGTYNSLSLTFASPELVIFNQSDTSIASTCAVGTVCQLTPTIDDSATVSFSSAPFPVTVSSTTPLGFLVDFHLNTVIQSDLSVNLGVTDGISVAELPSTPSHPQFGSITGEVESVSASNNQFTILTAWGRTFTVDTGSSTTFSDFPTSACTTAGIRVRGGWAGRAGAGDRGCERGNSAGGPGDVCAGGRHADGGGNNHRRAGTDGDQHRRTLDDQDDPA